MAKSSEKMDYKSEAKVKTENVERAYSRADREAAMLSQMRKLL
jgi:hypothetical protein